MFNHLEKFDGHTLIDVAREGVDLGDTEEEKQEVNLPPAHIMRSCCLCPAVQAQPLHWPPQPVWHGRPQCMQYLAIVMPKQAAVWQTASVGQACKEASRLPPC